MAQTVVYGTGVPVAAVPSGKPGAPTSMRTPVTGGPPPQDGEDGALGIADRGTRFRRVIEDAATVIAHHRVTFDGDGADVGAGSIRVQLDGGEVDAARTDRLPRAD